MNKSDKQVLHILLKEELAKHTSTKGDPFVSLYVPCDKYERELVKQLVNFILYNQSGSFTFDGKKPNTFDFRHQGMISIVSNYLADNAEAFDLTTLMLWRASTLMELVGPEGMPYSLQQELSAH